MSEPPSNWPPPPGQNPFGDQNPTPSPFAPGGPYHSRSPDIADDPAMRWVLPVGQSVWAIVAGYLGLFSLALCFLGPFAVIAGIMAIAAMRRNPRLSGWGRAIVGIVLGTLGTLGFVLMIIALAFG